MAKFTKHGYLLSFAMTVGSRCAVTTAADVHMLRIPIC